MLDEIMQLFSESESSPEHSQKIKYFCRAVKKIEEFVKTGASKQELETVRNLRLSYVRILLEQISPDSDLPYPSDDWPDYAKIFLITCNTEVEEITSKDQKLMQNFNFFIGSIRDDMNAYLERVETKKS